MAGALAAWAALLILVLLQDVRVIDIPLQTKDPLRDANSFVLALALVLGFSERFLQMLADRTMSAAV